VAYLETAVGQLSLGMSPIWLPIFKQEIKLILKMGVEALVLFAPLFNTKKFSSPSSHFYCFFDSLLKCNLKHFFNVGRR
jgi:hypothetical protein